jgi:protein-disulfide isomerase
MDPYQTPEKGPSPLVPIAIVVGFALVAAAIFVTSGPRDASPNLTDESQVSGADPLSSVRPVSADDYIVGNPNAPVVLIEYSDYDCPYCKRFHNTMHQIMDEYGVTGRVAWVYRQFPLVDVHPNATLISEAALCVGDIGGNEAFWDFSDAVFESRVDIEPTNVTRLRSFAEESGVNAVDYQSCMDSDRMMDRLKADMQDGLNAGAGAGTPYTVVMAGSDQAVITGAESYTFVKNVIDLILAQLDGQSATDNTAPAPATTQ